MVSVSCSTQFTVQCLQQVAQMEIQETAVVRRITEGGKKNEQEARPTERWQKKK